jgi:hypothetical protein
MLALSEGTGAGESVEPSLVTGLVGVGGMDVAQLIFRPSKHAAKETPHDLGGLIGTPGLDCNLDRDRVVRRRMVHFRRWRGRVVLAQAILSVGAGTWPGSKQAPR